MKHERILEEKVIFKKQFLPPSIGGETSDDFSSASFDEFPLVLSIDELVCELNI